jgi:predicted aminopeptidase
MLPGCGAGYVLRSGYYQMELLAHRDPVEEALRSHEYTARERASFYVVRDAKAFGREIGLAGTANYDTVAHDWDHRIWNVSASHPARFENRTWSFPIVGTVPYLGFFREGQARELGSELAAEGLDVYIRTAGTYSTLGWFEDPILRPMLSWSRYWLANTVLHEMTHATVWIPGSVNFNESFANFVGDVAAFRYLEARFGRESPEFRSAMADVADDEEWTRVLLGLYADLDTVYASDDPTLCKLERKREVLATLLSRVDASALSDKNWYRSVVALGPWNNARLAQFRTYNDDRPAFQALLDAHDGDLGRFMKAVATVTRGADDPYEALREAALTPAGEQ